MARRRKPTGRRDQPAPLADTIEPVGPDTVSSEPMTCDEARAIVNGSCWRKGMFGSGHAAMRRARTLHEQGLLTHPVVPYRCSFLNANTGDRAAEHWHIGAPPTFAQLQRMALAMRWLREHPDCVTSSA